MEAAVPHVVTAPWSVAEVLSLAPDARAASAARRCAVPLDWAGLGGDADVLWGTYRGGSGAEPYQVAVHLPTPQYRCTCPSRRSPCKHALALLLLWAAGHVVAAGLRPRHAEAWPVPRPAVEAPLPGGAGPTSVEPACGEPTSGEPSAAAVLRSEGGGGPPSRAAAGTRPGDGARAERRVHRAAAGLAELDRWLADRVRGGLAAPEVARYATWDEVAARLVDAQLTSLANRVRRLAGAVGTSAGWHEHVLAEMGVLHLLCEAGPRLYELPDDLADSARTALGWSVRQADVLATAPETDHWVACGRSDTLEDRIVVRRTWLRGRASQRWCLLLDFAAYGQSLADPWPPGHVVHADVHRYPGLGEVRGILGLVHARPEPLVERTAGLHPVDVAQGAADIGAALAAVPWIERWPVTLRAAPTRDGAAWVLTDDHGSLPLAPAVTGLSTLVALSRGGPVDVTCEWTAAGLVPLAVHGTERSVDIGPRGGFHEPRRRPWGGRRP
jgi:hypothetical protein